MEVVGCGAQGAPRHGPVRRLQRSDPSTTSGAAGAMDGLAAERATEEEGCDFEPLPTLLEDEVRAGGGGGRDKILLLGPTTPLGRPCPSLG